MVVIRLARHGRHKYPTYRIVAADKRRAATSKFLAILGTYNPHTKEVALKKEEIAQYLSNGAQASDRVLRILKSQGVDLPAWAKTHDRNKKPKKEAEATPEAVVDGGDQEATTEGEAKTAEVATSEATNAEEKTKDQKTDVGTIAEEKDKAKEAKATEETAKAVEETTAKEADKSK